MIFFIFLFLQSSVFAEYIYTCPDIQQTPNSAITIIGKLSGYDFFSVKATKLYFENYIKKNYNSDVKLQIKVKSLKALKNGEFKEVKANADKLNLGKYTISDFKARTLCPYNKISQIDNEIFFPHNIPIEYSAVITNEDFQSIIKGQNLSVPYGLIKKSDWVIEDSKIKIIIEYNVLFTTVKLTFSAGLKLKDGKIFFDSAEVINSPFKIDVNKILAFLDLYNPLIEIIKITENTFGYLTYDDIEIKNDKIYIKGMFLIPQNCDIKK